MKPQMVGRDGGFVPVSAAEGTTGLMADSIILTMKGEMPVADLRAGDRIITRDAGMVTVKSVRQRAVTATMVQIKAGSLGHTRPERDVLLPAGQAVLIRDWRARAVFGSKQAMVPAECLVDGEFITLQDTRNLTVYELEFDAPHVLYVDGLEVASHGDHNNYATAA